MARVVFPNALIVADAFHLHRRVLAALTEVRRDAWNRWRHRSRRLGKAFKDARFALVSTVTEFPDAAVTEFPRPA